MKIFVIVRIPKEIITDQGTNFMSQLLKDLGRILKVKALRMLVYHPQINRLVESFNRTLKQMLRRFVAMEPHHWDQLLPPVCHLRGPPSKDWVFPI